MRDTKTTPTNPLAEKLYGSDDPAPTVESTHPDGGDVRVVERREYLGLALEPHEPIRVGGEGLGQHLERDVAIELRVAGAVDLAHAARTQLGHDLVRTDCLADHGCGLGWTPTMGLVTRTGSRRKGSLIISPRRGLESFFGILLEAVADDGRERGGQRTAGHLDLRRVRRENRVHRFDARVTDEGPRARQHLVEHDAETEDVRALVDRPRANLFRRHVAEVEDLDPPVRGDEEVLGLDVAVRNAPGVSRGKAQRRLPRVVHGLGDGDRPASRSVRSVFPSSNSVAR